MWPCETRAEIPGAGGALCGRPAPSPRLEEEGHVVRAEAARVLLVRVLGVGQRRFADDVLGAGKREPAAGAHQAARMIPVQVGVHHVGDRVGVDARRRSASGASGPGTRS